MTRHPGQLTFIEDLERYVGFTEASAAALRQLLPLATPHFPSVVDDFYAAIRAHPDTSAVITGGDAQIGRLKVTLTCWLDTLLAGPHDNAYTESRARMGKAHVRIGLPQAFMFTAMNRVRLRLSEILDREVADRPTDAKRMREALDQILDIDLAIMLDAYREDILARTRKTERLATMGEFATSIGHELRNPLGVIESSLFLVRQHLPPAASSHPDATRHIEQMEGEVRRSKKIIEDLLSLARSRPPSRAPTALPALIDAAVAASSLPAEIEVRVRVPPGLEADLDAEQIRQALVNLLANASHTMGGRGRVHVTAEAAPGGVWLRVRDEGPSIAPDARQRIFEPLFTSQVVGNGLGLALCRRIVEAHGGTIDLEGTATGTCFAAWLPAGPVSGSSS
jgi:signal transduction histidine kinase